MYLYPVTSRFVTQAPSAHRLIEGLSTQRGEDIVPSGAASANARGLTTHVPAELIYWTSGRSRKLNLEKLFVAGRDRFADEGSTGTHASCLDPDHDERVRTGNVVIEAGSE
jgi:hypothetical protein